jgi:gliding motility-associated-like protein
MKTLILGIFYVFLCLPSLAQLDVQNTQSVQWYVEQILLGGGVQVSNVTFNGLPANDVSVQVGYFNSDNANVGISSGMILACGEVVGAVGPNNTTSSTFPDTGLNLSGDTDLDEFTNFGTFDAAVLEFDFIPQGDSLSFNYVFASEEFPEFANDIYNDVFGFFLAGPGITGTFSSPAGFPGGSINIATLPGSNTEVSINNINNGNANTGPCENCEYYVANGDGNEAPYDEEEYYIQYDGLTTVLNAFAVVECGSTYHIKIVLADAGDSAYDSAVFLQEGSFQTNQSIALDLSFDFPNAISPDLVFEGCYTGTIAFVRFANLDEEEVINVTYAGTAINGVDYALLPTSVNFPAGSTTVELTLIGLEDALAEGQEDLIIQFTEMVCGLPQVNEFVFYIQDDAGPINMPFTSYSIDCNESVIIGGSPSGGIGLYEYAWESGEDVSNIEVSPLVTTGYTLTVTDTCTAEPFEITYLVDVPVNPPVEAILPADITLDCSEDVVSIIPLTAIGGNGFLNYEWTVDGAIVSTAPSLDWTTDSDISISLTLTDGCGAQAMDILDVITLPYELISVNLPPAYSLNCLLLETEIIPLNVGGGQGDLILSWDQDGIALGPGPTVIVGTESSSYVTLSVSDECGFENSYTTILTYLEAAPISVQAGSDQTLICGNPEVNLIAGSITGGQGALTIGWYESGVLVGMGTSVSALTIDEDTFVLKATDGCNQVGMDSIIVTLAPYSYPTVYIDGSGAGCPGDLVTLTALPENGIVPYTYLWTHNGPGDAISYDNPEVSTAYAVTITDACGNETVAITEMVILPVAAGFQLELTDYYGFSTMNTSFSMPGDSLSYFWYLDQELISEDEDLLMPYTDLNDHVVSLAIENSVGCRDSVFTETHPPSSVFVPNAFSPDGDGVNDLFKVITHDIIRYELSIFNRWGELIFQTEDVDIPWNGAGVEEGKYFSQDGIYAYTIRAEGVDGRFYDLKGDVVVLR